ncbi:MAG TPA: PIN domain-containing protein, partial [Anaeromyxobacteraceae bacterium]|nr:PIN domain-containing protein [Anaeromyxobacteraceae bacterium]
AQPSARSSCGRDSSAVVVARAKERVSCSASGLVLASRSGWFLVSASVCVLQGFREERAYRLAREAMFALPIVDSPLPSDRFEAAVDLYRRCHSRGITVRSSIDCLIAASAVEHDLVVLHHDRDYALIARASPLCERSV